MNRVRIESGRVKIAEDKLPRHITVQVTPRELFSLIRTTSGYFLSRNVDRIEDFISEEWSRYTNKSIPEALDNGPALALLDYLIGEYNRQTKGGKPLGFNNNPIRR